jgi:hypothetical protein
MEEQFITDDIESRLKLLREQLIFWEEQYNLYDRQLEDMEQITGGCTTREYGQIKFKWNHVLCKRDDLRSKVSALEKEIAEEQKLDVSDQVTVESLSAKNEDESADTLVESENSQESVNISVDDTLHFEGKEEELVITELNDAKLISDDVLMSTQRQEFVSCENQEQLLDEESNWRLIEQLEIKYDEESEVEDSQGSTTVTTITDWQELSQCCYSIEEKLILPQLIIIKPEKIKVTPELNAAEFIETEISGDMKESTKDNNIQNDAGDAISAESVVFGGSVANDIVIGKSADTFRGGTYYSYYLKELMRADVYADYDQQKIYYQLTTAEVVKTEVKSESPVYSDRIKNVFKQVLKLQLTSEDNNEEEVLET